MNKGKNVTNQDKAGFLQKYAIYSNTELFFVLFLYNYCAFAGVLGGFFPFFFPPETSKVTLEKCFSINHSKKQ